MIWFQRVYDREATCWPQAGMAWRLAPNGVEKPRKSHQKRERLVFAGYSEYGKWLERNIVNRLKHWEKFDGVSIVLIDGPTGTGKTFGVKYAAQAASAILIMRSPGELRSVWFSESEHLRIFVRMATSS